MPTHLCRSDITTRRLRPHRWVNSSARILRWMTMPVAISTSMAAPRNPTIQRGPKNKNTCSMRKYWPSWLSTGPTTVPVSERRATLVRVLAGAPRSRTKAK